MTQKHTPAPWHEAEDQAHGTRRIYAPDGYMVADAGRIFRRSSSEMGANARLIAAAPELLEALISARHEIWELTHHCTSDEKFKEQYGFIDLAIAKAKGE
jgi:hypothetical protein